VYAFLLPGMLLFAATRWNNGASRIWPGLWPWIVSLAVFAVWAVGGVRGVPGFYDQVVLREFLGRFGGEYHRAQPWFFYLPQLLHKFAPWSLLLIVFVVAEFQSRPREERLTAWLRGIPAEKWWLICWVLGAIVVMSVLPSKRVDRIFPIIPPLCLLLAAQIGPFLSKPEFYRWSAIALAFALVFTSTYVVWKVGSGYREHRDALAVFGKEVRKEADVHHWRYAIVSSPDEGLLLYLRKTEFFRPERAISEWNDGKLDALVVSERDVATLFPNLSQNPISALHSRTRRTGDTAGYLLVAKTAQPASPMP
jgi:hypothetical protein